MIEYIEYDVNYYLFLVENVRIQGIQKIIMLNSSLCMTFK